LSEIKKSKEGGKKERKCYQAYGVTIREKNEGGKKKGYHADTTSLLEQ
jgi:hypothetical protein